MRVRKLLLASLAGFALSLALASSITSEAAVGADDQKPMDDKLIKVAVDMGFSGSGAIGNHSAARAFELAVTEANTAGFPNGYYIQTAHFDQGVPGKTWDADLAAQNARDNVADPKIVAVFGPGSSTPARIAIPIWNAAGLAAISSTTTNPGLTQGPAAASLRAARPHANNFFRVCGTDDQQGPALAQFVKQMGVKDVYVIDDGDTYGKSLAEFFEASFKAQNGTVDMHERTQLTERDYRDIVERIKQRKPQGVFFGGYGIELGVFRKQMGDAGLSDVPLFGGDAMNDSDFAPAAGPAAEKSYYTIMTPNGLYLTTRSAKHFAKAFEDAYSTKPLPFDTGSYAAGQVMMAAIRTALARNGGAFPTRDQVREAMAGTRDLETAVGPVSFSAIGDIRDPYVSYYTYDQQGHKTFFKQLPYRSKYAEK